MRMSFRAPSLAIDRKPARGRNSGASFTLPEILAACAIFSFMVIVLLSLVANTSRIWQQTNGERIDRESARILLGMIGRDLENAVLPVNLNAQSPFTFQLNTVVPTNACSLFWQTAIVGTGITNGDIADVGYFVQWTPDPRGSGQIHGTLCRYYVPASATNPASAFVVYSGGTQAAPDLYTYAPGLNNTNSYRGLLADNVLGLWVTLYQANGTVLASPYTYAYSSVVAPPAYADISVATLDPVIAQRINTSAILTTITNSYGSNTNAAGFVANLPTSPINFRAGAQAYSTRIQIQTAQ